MGAVDCGSDQSAGGASGALRGGADECRQDFASRQAGSCRDSDLPT